MQYNDENDTLIRSDIEELNGDAEASSIENGKQKALILAFSLPSSSYATMALREILKTDTSVANQVQLQQTIATEIECSIASKKPKLDETSEKNEETSEKNEMEK